MSAASLYVRWAAALALGLAAGCGGSLPTPASPTDDASQASVGAPLLTLIANAPGSVMHAGVRRYESYGYDGSQIVQFAYREQRFADGAGKFAVTPLELIAPAMTPGDEALFFLTQKLRERMMYLARDFGVRDLDLFAANYTLLDTGVTTSVAGVSCARLVVTKRNAPDRRFVLDVDGTNGLVLSALEELLDGTPVSRTVYEAISYTPDLTNVVWNVPINGELDLVPGTSDAVTSLGFQPRTPKVLPDGWQQIGLAKLVDPTNDQVWARVTYSDGVEQIFFVVAKGAGPKHQVKNPPAGSPPKDPDRVRRLAVGAWTLLEADLAFGRALVLGRAPAGVLEGLVQSAFY